MLRACRDGEYAPHRGARQAVERGIDVGKGKRVQFPLVRSDHPGTLDLTNERIAEILDEEEVARYSKFFMKLNEPE
jgi:hypothetical protein